MTLETTVKVINTVSNTVIAFMSMYISYSAHKYNKRKISDKVWDKYNLTYSQITESMGLVLRDGFVSNNAYFLIWQARDSCRLYLHKDIQEYTDDLFDLMQKAFSARLLYQDENLGTPKRTEKVKSEYECIEKILNFKPPYTIFQKYLGIKN